jgi:hypothetical protein
MNEQTVSMNMQSWLDMGWTITSAHIPEVLEPLLWPVPTEVISLDAEDEMDLATAERRLDEIENDPTRLVKGEELRARLDSLET